MNLLANRKSPIRSVSSIEPEGILYASTTEHLMINAKIKAMPKDWIYSHNTDNAVFFPFFILSFFFLNTAFPPPLVTMDSFFYTQWLKACFENISRQLQSSGQLRESGIDLIGEVLYNCVKAKIKGQLWRNLFT